jgi:hypothetical protein
MAEINCFDNKGAIVTGASTGIGRAIARSMRPGEIPAHFHLSDVGAAEPDSRSYPIII